MMGEERRNGKGNNDALCFVKFEYSCVVLIGF